MQILNIAGYKFTPIAENELGNLQQELQHQAEIQDLKGTILLSVEGININLSGIAANIQLFQGFLRTTDNFNDMRFHATFSEKQPFQQLKVKIKKEIITFGISDLDVSARAPSISAETFKQWQNEKRDIVILDTRNDYEIQFGTFKNALNLHMKDFGEFPEAIKNIEKEKAIVMFCTGGIRCEKAAQYMLAQGYAEVYQLDGGILGYFAQVGGEHYQGECFVFDERISLDVSLRETHTTQCHVCQAPITKEHQPHACTINANEHTS